MTPPVSASLIVKDEAATIERCVESIRPFVDEVCILDTGSTDRTLDLLDRLAAQPGAPIRVRQAAWPGHFGKARAMALEFVAHDWVVSIDADELLVGGEHLQPTIETADSQGKTALVVAWNAGDLPWRKTVRLLRQHKPDSMWLRKLEPLPQEAIQPSFNKVYRRTCGRWQGLVHERWRADDPSTVMWTMPMPGVTGRLHVYHLRRVYRPERYDPLMEQAAADPAGTDTPYAAGMIGIQHVQARRFRKGIPALEAYLAGPDDDPLSRLDALVHLVIAYAMTGRHDEADDARTRRESEFNLAAELGVAPAAYLAAHRRTAYEMDAHLAQRSTASMLLA